MRASQDTGLRHRLATPADIPALHEVMHRSIETLQGDFLSAEQIAASHHVMGLDSQLVADGTYYLVEEDRAGGRVAGCGGWSWRATLFGGDESVVAREPARLDPATDAAKIRAMYTDPDFVRRGVGTLVLDLCEDAARGAGFMRVELMATAAGVPLYTRCGYRPSSAPERVFVEGIGVPLVRMEKSLG